MRSLASKWIKLSKHDHRWRCRLTSIQTTWLDEIKLGTDFIKCVLCVFTIKIIACTMGQMRIGISVMAHGCESSRLECAENKSAVIYIQYYIRFLALKFSNGQSDYRCCNRISSNCHSHFVAKHILAASQMAQWWFTAKKETRTIPLHGILCLS